MRNHPHNTRINGVVSLKHHISNCVISQVFLSCYFFFKKNYLNYDTSIVHQLVYKLLQTDSKNKNKTTRPRQARCQTALRFLIQIEIVAKPFISIVITASWSTPRLQLSLKSNQVQACPPNNEELVMILFKRGTGDDDDLNEFHENPTCQLAVNGREREKREQKLTKLVGRERNSRGKKKKSKAGGKNGEHCRGKRVVGRQICVMRWREEKGIGSPHKNGGALNESNISGSILIDSLYCFYLHCLFLLIIFLNNILLTQHVCNKLLSLCPSILSLFVKTPPLPSSLSASLSNLQFGTQLFTRNAESSLSFSAFYFPVH